MTTSILSLNDIFEARKRIDKYVHRTPVFSSNNLNDIFGSAIFFKCENFQKVGAFKYRGACNAVFSLKNEDAKNGVATHSSGNHAAALALAAKIRGISAHVVMPETSPETKKRAVFSYGAKITYCEPTLLARETTLQEVVNETGARFIHPFDNEKIIAGQGTATVEFLEEKPDLDILIAPIGGGGLMSGTAIAAKGIKKNIEVIGTEPKMADDAFKSFKSGILVPSVNPQTIADGLLTSQSELTFSIIKKNVDDIVTVDEKSIVEAMRLVWERMKIIIEPSSAVPLAALLEKKIQVKNKKVGIIISGGNVDLSRNYF
ncbi:MAG: pyridoxal-phosphate dependent enzyme [Bacteroidetes bacterium]|nr:pyridoxal-phosphate dependent enzyme [Bacteroidota bacterium]MBT6686036.1 pyridoxal-phosphate dependent enzyme [Bacteroidota bacterium]MBT7144545.1 pyridoxal-phosphate dependent enzyme [Bacteroidota bacterium]MBT7492692.1 pyridoxal-phosphate dependent enzyme [Bacteroidota bacterium]